METVEDRFKKVWSDFTVRDETAYATKLDIAGVTSSDNARLLALSFFRDYNGFDGTAYGEGLYNFGMTEQEAYDLWLLSFNSQEQIVKRQLSTNGVVTISQSAYDGMILYHWATGRSLQVNQGEIEYQLINSLVKHDYETVANMIVNSSNNVELCRKIATVIRLADYGRPKTRAWYREKGVFTMRDYNEKGTLSNDQLTRARFSYYAETLNFLPYTPEGSQRILAKEYEKTLVIQNFTYSGTNTFTLERSVSMSPMEKLKVTINDNIQQHLFDFTVDGTTLTISESMNTGDIIKTTIKI